MFVIRSEFLLATDTKILVVKCAEAPEEILSPVLTHNVKTVPDNSYIQVIKNHYLWHRMSSIDQWQNEKATKTASKYGH